MSHLVISHSLHRTRRSLARQAKKRRAHNGFRLFAEMLRRVLGTPAFA